MDVRLVAGMAGRMVAEMVVLKDEDWVVGTVEKLAVWWAEIMGEGKVVMMVGKKVETKVFAKVDLKAVMLEEQKVASMAEAMAGAQVGWMAFLRADSWVDL